ncbi:sensor histidine kinase [Streptomyces apocyni]|uniref:sensor histidine kinase n=1 Tax=Streptomyces apocyni TaxID=2654677 RepID=UPI001E4895CB|nr:histidine kinase [Streptomyces apocyni]
MFCYGLIMVLNVVGEYADARKTTISIGCVVALVTMQVIHSSRAAPSWPLRRKVALLCLQAAITAVPTIAYGLMWGSMWGFLGGSLLLMLPRKPALICYGLVFINTVVLAINIAPTGLYAIYLVQSSVLATLVIYGFTKLTVLMDELLASRSELARMAVSQERLRFARDLHDLLGYSLSAITLKGELVRRLIAASPDEAQRETTSLLEVARQALGDVRLVSSGYRDMSLRDEGVSAESVLAAAEVEAEVDIDCGRLHPVVDTVLATALREGVTNILRHSKVRSCTISATIEGEESVVLRLVNDGADERREVSALRHGGGSGLDNLRERFAAIGGQLTAGPLEDGIFQLEARAPLRPRTEDEAAAQARAGAGAGVSAGASAIRAA